MADIPAADASAARGPGLRLRQLLPLLVVLTGAVALSDWLFHFTGGAAPRLATMKANAAIGFLALGVGLLVITSESTRTRRVVAASLGAFAAALALLTLAEYTAGVSLRIDELLALDPDTPRERFPGRMAPATTLALFGGGAALTLLASASARREGVARKMVISHSLAALPAAIGYLSLAGYAYDFAALYGFGPFTSVSPLTALDSTLVALSIFCFAPELGWGAPFVDRPATWRTLRRLLPFALIAPLLGGVLIVFGARAGLYPQGFMPALFALAAAVLTLATSVFAITVLKREEGRLIESQAALHESEERLRLFVAHAPAAVAMFDKDVRYLAASRRWMDDYGLEGPIVGRSHYEVFPEIPERWREVHRRVLAGESLRADDDSLERANGAVQHLRWEALPWRTTRGEIGGLMIAIEDVTARRQVERGLRESEERFRAVVSSAMDGIIAVDAEQNVVLFNAAAEAMFGCKSEEAIGASIEHFIPERFRTGHRDHVRRFGESGVTARAMKQLGVLRGLKANGEEFPIEASISQLAVDDKRIFTVILRDITERKRAEDALRESEERFSLFMQKLAACAWIKDEQGRYVFVNQAFLNFVDKPLDRILDKTDQEIFDAETAAVFMENDRAAFNSASGVTTIEPVHDKRGMTRYFLASKFAILSNFGKKLVAGVAIDDTDRMVAEDRLKEASEKLQEADRRKDEFIAVLAHELRNPLAPIRNGLQVLRRTGGQADKAERVQGMMERQVDHLIRLVDDLLEISRISRGQIDLRKERVNLATVIGYAVDMIRDLIDAGGLELSVVLPDAPSPLDADPVRLTQVFANLLSNAAKFTDPGGRVEILAQHENGWAVVTVADTGAGITKDLLPHVFDLFVQAGERRARLKGGLGIGLALVRSLVELHGGTVEAHSDGEGRGARFVVRLPLSTGAEATASPERTEACGARSFRRVLVVDDDHDVADSLALLLGMLGANVRVARSGAEGLAVCAEFAPEVVFLDVGMPGMDGYETARRMRELPVGRDALLVALTGWAEEEARRRVNEAGFDAHLTKPADIGELEALLETASPKRG